MIIRSEFQLQISKHVMMQAVSTLAIEAARDAARHAKSFPVFRALEQVSNRVRHGERSGCSTTRLERHAQRHFPVSVRNSESLVNGSHDLHPLIGVKDVGTRLFSRAWARAEATTLA